jgi:hypothetical protein
MNPFTVKGFLGSDSPAVFDVNIAAKADYDRARQDPQYPVDEHYVKGIVDTGSRQTLIMPGLFAGRHFGQNPLFCDLRDASLKEDRRRGQVMSITFSNGEASKTIDVPVYEMRFSLIHPPEFMLIGRSILRHAVFCFDGPNRMATLTFADNSRIANDAKS